MTKIESKKTEIAASSKQVYDFLMDMNNIQKLLPEGKYSNWISDIQSCSFKMQNAYNVSLNFSSSEPTTNVSYASGTGMPFPFSLVVNLIESNGLTTAQLLSEAKINPFMEMMVKGPLKNLFDYMAERLVVQFPAS
jgi:carbon monoxide dehydrogenase subunit G